MNKFNTKHMLLTLSRIDNINNIILPNVNANMYDAATKAYKSFILILSTRMGRTCGCPKLPIVRLYPYVTTFTKYLYVA